MKAGATSGTPTFSMPTATERILKQREREIVDSPIELGSVHDLSGYMFGNYTGTKDRIVYDRSGDITIHNHPNGLGGFSPADLYAARVTVESRMVTRDSNGKAWEFKLQRPLSNVPGRVFGEWPDMRQVSRSLQRREGQLIRAKMTAGKTYPTNLQLNSIYHKAAKEIFKQYGIGYSRKPL